MDILSYCLIAAAVINTATQETPTFSIHSTMGQVLRAQGAPSRLNRMSHLQEEIWWYGPSLVSFRGGRVHGWMNLGKNLNIERSKDTSTFIKDNRFPLAFGDTQEKILDTVGPPDFFKVFEAINEEIWFYGSSTITFQNGIVAEWSDYGPHSQNKRLDYRDEVGEELAADGNPHTDEAGMMFRRIDPASASRFQGIFHTDGDPHTDEHNENRENTILGPLDHLRLGPVLDTGDLIKNATLEESLYNLAGKVKSATADVKPATDAASLQN